MNKKKVIIICLACTLLLIISIVVSYVVTKGNSKENNIPDIVEDKSNSESPKNEENIQKNKNEFKNIDINSDLANRLLDFVPKSFQTETNKMSNEYIIYFAINYLENNNEKTEYTIDDTFKAYEFNKVEEAAKKMFGPSIKIEGKTKYNLPIKFDEKSNLLCKLPFGFGGNEEYQIIKELKENNEKFILTVYAINLQYDIDTPNYIKISTKDTFKLYSENSSDTEAILNSMIKYKVEGIDLPIEQIVRGYSEKLPTIEFDIVKLDERGTDYYIKSIKTIF